MKQRVQWTQGRVPRGLVKGLSVEAASWVEGTGEACRASSLQLGFCVQQHLTGQKSENESKEILAMGQLLKA